ncbi:MAG: BatD family protein [bacterium]
MSNKSRCRIFVLLFIFLAVFGTARAGDIAVSAGLDKTSISLDETATLSVEISGAMGNLPEPNLPEIEGFSVQGAGQSQNISMINGKISASVVHQYILTPRKAGSFSIPAISLEYQGKTYQTEPLTIEVARGQSSRNLAPPPPGLRHGKRLFVESAVDKKEAYVNEQITFTFRFYRAVNPLSQPGYQPPETTGFWTEDLPPQKNYRTDISGTPYAVSELRLALFPMAPGEYTIGSARLRCRIEDFAQDDLFGDDAFRNFFGGEREVLLSTDPIKIRVLPLPAGKPAGFSGAVGSYTMKAGLDKKSVPAGQPVTLAVTISGKGNIKTIEAPAFPDFSGFRNYEPTSSSKISKEDYRVQGFKTFQAMLIPDAEGEKSLPPLTWSYFDPVSRSYQTLTTSSLPLSVTPGSGGSSASPAAPGTSPVKAAPVQILSRDIRFIKDPPVRLTKGKVDLCKNPLFLLLQFLPLAALLFVVLRRRALERINRDPLEFRRRRALSDARKALHEAARLIHAGKVGEFYALLSKALQDYCSGKLAGATAGLPAREIARILDDKEAPGGNFCALLEAADEARFSASRPTAAQMKAHLREAGRLLGELEGKLS